MFEVIYAGDRIAEAILFGKWSHKINVNLVEMYVWCSKSWQGCGWVASFA